MTLKNKWGKLSSFIHTYNMLVTFFSWAQKKIGILKLQKAWKIIIKVS